MSGPLHALVTGATSGIGEAIARGLAAAGVTTVIAGRDAVKGRRVAERLAAETGNERVQVLTADLSRVAGARGLARGYRERFGRLDLLINNAGGMFRRRRTSADGFEMTLALNHLGPFVLTRGLLDLLESAAAENPGVGGRIVTVASDAHRSGVRWDDLQSERNYRMYRAYAQSKAMNLLFTFELARRLEGSGVVANAYHPGLVRTNILGNAGMPLAAALFRLVGPLIAATPEQGARTGLHLATSPEVRGVTGRYFIDCEQREPAEEMLDKEAQGRLWELSENWARSPG